MSLSAQEILLARIRWGHEQDRAGVRFDEQQIRLLNAVTELLCVRAVANTPEHPEPSACPALDGCPCDGAARLTDAARMQADA